MCRYLDLKIQKRMSTFPLFILQLCALPALETSYLYNIETDFRHYFAILGFSKPISPLMYVSIDVGPNGVESWSWIGQSQCLKCLLPHQENSVSVSERSWVNFQSFGLMVLVRLHPAPFRWKRLSFYTVLLHLNQFVSDTDWQIRSCRFDSYLEQY